MFLYHCSFLCNTVPFFRRKNGTVCFVPLFRFFSHQNKNGTVFCTTVPYFCTAVPVFELLFPFLIRNHRTKTDQCFKALFCVFVALLRVFVPLFCFRALLFHFIKQNNETKKRTLFFVPLFRFSLLFRICTTDPFFP